MKSTKTITVVFTRYEDTLSKLVYLISGRGYTHTAISMVDDDRYFYSFNYKGFRREYPDRYKKHSLNNLSCQLSVSGDDYEKMQSAIRKMERRKEDFRFTLFGVIMCILGIPMKMKNRYFCSQFVAETLSISRDIQLKKHPSLYLPNHLLKELEMQKKLKAILPDYVGKTIE